MCYYAAMKSELLSQGMFCHRLFSFIGLWSERFLFITLFGSFLHPIETGCPVVSPVACPLCLINLPGTEWLVRGLDRKSVLFHNTKMGFYREGLAHVVDALLGNIHFCSVFLLFVLFWFYSGEYITIFLLIYLDYHSTDNNWSSRIFSELDSCFVLWCSRYL